jgi:hypothetical protein
MPGAKADDRAGDPSHLPHPKRAGIPVFAWSATRKSPGVGPPGLMQVDPAMTSYMIM